MEETIVNERVSAGKSQNKEINLKEWTVLIKRRIWVVLLSTLLVGTLGGLYSSIPEAPLYDASARIIVSAGSSEMLLTLRAFIQEPVVVEKALNELGLKRSVSYQRSQISVGSVDNSIITVIRVFDEDPQLAVKITNALVSSFTEEAASRLKFNGVEVLSLAEETPNPIPVNPPSKRALIVGIIGGLIIGIALAFFLDSLDDSIKSEEDIAEVLGLSTLGQVSRIPKKELFRKVKRKNEYIRGETIGS